MTVERPTSHSLALDGLRGLAIAIVLLHNLNIIEDEQGLLSKVLMAAANAGWTGVTLFFVLSGFLITRILLATQSSPTYFRSFFGRRALRILPLYYVTLAFMFIVLPRIGHAPQAILDEAPKQLWYWVYLSNWAHVFGEGMYSMPHLWSLAIEEQFYLLWPLFVWRRTARQVLVVCAVVTVASIASRALLIADGADPMQVYTMTVCRIDSLAMGAAGAALLAIRRAPEQQLALIRPMLVISAISAGLLCTSSEIHGMTDALGQIAGYMLLNIMFTTGLLAAVIAESHRLAWWVRPLQWAPLRILGKYSYAIYMFHAILHGMAGEAIQRTMGMEGEPSTVQGISYLAVVSLATLALALLSYHLLEKHFLQLKRHLPA